MASRVWSSAGMRVPAARRDSVRDPDQIDPGVGLGNATGRAGGAEAEEAVRARLTPSDRKVSQGSSPCPLRPIANGGCRCGKDGAGLLQIRTTGSSPVPSLVQELGHSLHDEKHGHLVKN